MGHHRTNLAEESPSKQSVQEMFKACMAREDRILSSNYKSNVQKAYKNILFGVPLFWPDPIGSYGPFKSQFSRSREPFTFSVAQQEHEELSTAEWRYKKLLELLRAEREADLRWLLLARWMKQEKVGDPEDFLPKPILDRIVRRYLKSTRASASDLSYWALVTGWIPYFVRLQSDLQKLTEKGMNPQLALEGLGFEPRAIQHAVEKRSTGSAIIHWVSERRNLRPETLWNAYSRRKPKKRLRSG